MLMKCEHQKGRECKYCGHNEIHEQDHCTTVVARYCVFGDVVHKCIPVNDKKE